MATEPAPPAGRFWAVMTPPALRWMLAATLASGAVLGLSACGSGDTASTTKDASSPGASCPEQKSLETYIVVANDLDHGVALDVPRGSWSCDGYSGVSTPGVFDGVTVRSQPYKRRVEVVRGPGGDALIRSTAFTLKLRANAVLATLQIARFQWGRGGRQAYGIEIDGEWWCGKAVEFRDATGRPAWARITTCDPNEPATLQLTNVMPASTAAASSSQASS